MRIPTGPWDQARIYLMPFSPVSRANVGLSDASLAPTESGTALSVAGVAALLPFGHRTAPSQRPHPLGVAPDDSSLTAPPRTLR